MKSEWIETILAVEQTRSFSRSADMLYCSQSAVTRMVQSAEEELGLQIFSRQSKKASVELTADGNRIMPFIRAAGQANETLFDAAKFMRSKVVTLCWSPHMFNSYSKVTLLERFYDENPNIVLKIKYLPTAECLADLRTGASDVALSSQVFKTDDPVPELDFGDEYNVVDLGVRNICLAVGAQYAPKGKDTVCINDLRLYSLIMMRDSASGTYVSEDQRSQFIIKACKDHGFSPNLFCVDNPEDIKDIIALQGRGVYLSTAPENLRRTPGISYIPIIDAPFKVVYYLLSRRDNPNKAIEKLEKAVVPLFKNV